MTREMSTKPQVHLIRPYLVWTFGWSWGCWLLTILSNDLPVLPRLSNILATFGPVIGSMIVLKKSPKDMLSFISHSKRGSYLYLLLFVTFFTASIMPFASLLPDLILLKIFISFLVTTVLTGGNEEVGWRGFLQPALEKQLAFPVATSLTGLIWASWHIPLWFMPGTSQNGVSFPIFMAFCILASFWLAALHKKTQSILYCVLFHGLINTIGEGVFTGKGTENPLFFIGYILMAVYASWLWHRTDQEEKQL